MRSRIICLLLSGVSVLLWADPRPSAQELLKLSDRSRGGLVSGLVWNIDIRSEEDGVSSQRSFHVKAKADDAIAVATAPARNKGEVYLFNDRTMWYFKPGLRKPVHISAREKLTGQAANGDIASTHYSRDYDGEIVRLDTINGEKAYVLELKAKNKNVTYDQIRYWIGAGSKLGLKAEFLSLEGKVLKTATFAYGGTIKADGAIFPFVTEMAIADAKMTGNKSVITYHEPKTAEVPASAFNINNLVQ